MNQHLCLDAAFVGLHGLWRWLVRCAALVVLVACGGGSDDAPPDGAGPPTLPAAVTSVVPATGAEIVVPLADRAEAVLVFPPSAYAAEQTVTLTPMAPEAGEWTRFRMTPGTGALRAPVTLVVRPPSSVAADQFPAIQLFTADGPVLLPTKRRADGALEARLPAVLTRSLQATRRAAALRVRPAADGEDGGTTVAGVGTVILCSTSDAVLADARRVLDNASTTDRILHVIGMLAAMHDNCGAPDVEQRLADFALQAAAAYDRSLQAWRAIDFADLGNRFQDFGVGMRRALAWCAAAQTLGAGLVCPRPDDYVSEFTELKDGFRLAAAQTEDTASLRTMLLSVLRHASDAAAFGAGEVQARLFETGSGIADRLVERAYALCHHRELNDMIGYIDAGGPTSYGIAGLQLDIAICGLGLATFGRESVLGPEIAGTRRELVVGAADGTGRVRDRQVTLPLAAKLYFEFTPAPQPIRCGRAIGSPTGMDELSVRADGVELRRISMRNAAGEVITSSGMTFFHDLGSTQTALGRAPDSTQPIVFELFRVNAIVQGCSDENGDPYVMGIPDQRLYRLTVTPTAPAVQPTRWEGTLTITERVVRAFESSGPVAEPGVVGSSTNSELDETNASATLRISIPFASTGDALHELVPGFTQPTYQWTRKQRYLSTFSGIQEIGGSQCSFSQRHEKQSDAVGPSGFVPHAHEFYYRRDADGRFTIFLGRIEAAAYENGRETFNLTSTGTNDSSCPSDHNEVVTSEDVVVNAQSDWRRVFDSVSGFELSGPTTQSTMSGTVPRTFTRGDGAQVTFTLTWSLVAR